MNMSEPAQFGMLRGEMRNREPMARHVSWRAGGHAERAYVPADLADLVTLMRVLPREEPVYMVGLGSNLLVRDGGLRGTVVLLHGVLSGITVEGDVIRAEAGVPAPKVARVAAMNGLTGAEFIAGIPGTVGGALAMNAGCYGGETWRIVASVTTIDRAGNLRDREPVDYHIAYRTVVLKEQSAKALGEPSATPHASRLTPLEEWFVAARFKLPRGDSTESRKRIKELLGRRIASQPLDQPNAGSVFRNPPNDFAARLIEACGLKGARIGGAMISDKHSNFIVNTGGAAAADIEALIEMARTAVRAKFGVELEREVRIIGEAIKP
jgi:UDP-N-acetylmuramate dehydrogenase